MEIKQLFFEFLDSNLLVGMLYFYLLCLVIYCVYSTLNYFKYFSKMQKKIQQIYTQMSEQEKTRAQAERNQRDMYGSGIKRDWLARLDEELAYSGIKEKVRWMTTELYILIMITFVLLSATVTIVISSNVVYGIAIALAILVLFKLTVSLLANTRDRKTEALMLQFMNIVDNFSRTSDDLITILEKAAKYVEDPLGTQIYDAVVEARNTGDSLLALQELQDKVKNKHFKVLVRNLEISSRFETNYSDIIEDCRDIFHTYLKSEKEKRSIRVNGILEISTMLLCGFFCIYVIGDITEGGNIISVLMSGGTLGKGILIYMVVSVMAALYIAIFQILRSK